MKTKQLLFTMHHLEDVIHHWPAMSLIQNSSNRLLAFSLYTLHRPQLSALYFLLIIQQTFQVRPTITTVISHSKSP